MNDENNLRQRQRGPEKNLYPSASSGQAFWQNRTDPSAALRAGAGHPAGVPYNAKDFQLEVLDRLEEMRSFADALDQSWDKKLAAVKEQRLLKFDSRTLIALGALALSLIAYVVQDARNTARQDSEIEATKARVVRLEQIATTNTEARIRTEVQLGELRDGQNEIKALIQAHDNATRKFGARK
jgi:soluble cytochrome b562